LLGRPDAREENSNQLFTFPEDRGHALLGMHFGFLNRAEPSLRLFQLFQANLMNEVFAEVGRLNFPVMTIWGGPAAKKLPSNMVSRSCIRKSINQSNNSRTEF
jgi:hypothetical protein